MCNIQTVLVKVLFTVKIHHAETEHVDGPRAPDFFASCSIRFDHPSRENSRL